MTHAAIALTIGLDAVRAILEKARALEIKVDRIETEGGPPAVELVEAMRADPTYEALRFAIEALDENEQIDLLALMWIGRGDFALKEWEEARRLARVRRAIPTVHYIACDPLACEDIEEGLTLLGYEIGDGRPGDGRPGSG